MANKTSYPNPVLKYLTVIVIAIMVMVTLYFANYLIKRAQTLQIGAASGNAQLFFEPSSITLPPTSTVNLWATTDKTLGYVQADFTFDPTVLKLTQEISVVHPSLKKIIRQTSMAEANTTGKVSLILGLDPTLVTSAPVGSFKLATLNFSAKVATANLATTLAFTPSSLQLVDMNATPFNLTQTAATLTLNPSSAPSPSPSSGTTGSTVSGGPVATFIRTPMLETKNGADQIYVGVQSTPSVGPATIEFWFDGVKINAYNNTDNRYQYTYKPASLAAGSHTIVMKVYDNTPARNMTQLTALIKK